MLPGFNPEPSPEYDKWRSELQPKVQAAIEEAKMLIKFPPGGLSHREDIPKWSDGEAFAISIHPMATGVGTHPQMLSDVSWVLEQEENIADMSPWRYWAFFLHNLAETEPLWLEFHDRPIIYFPPRNLTFAPPSKAASRLTKTFTKEDMLGPIPKPNVVRTTSSEGGKVNWTEARIRGILCNPLYAGIGVAEGEGFVTHEDWVISLLNQHRLDEEGMNWKQILVNVLYLMRETFGSHHRPGIAGVAPGEGLRRMRFLE